MPFLFLNYRTRNMEKQFTFIYTGIFFFVFLFFPTTPSQTAPDPLRPFQQDLHEDISKAKIFFPFVKKHAGGEIVSLPLVLAIMKAESNFRSEAKSSKGALGLMQLMPETAIAEYKKSGIDAPPAKVKEHLLKQPELNVILGIKYLQNMEDLLSDIRNADKRRTLVIASYNAGFRRARRAFGCRDLSCLVHKVNKQGNRNFQKAIRRLPRETRSYLIVVYRSFQLYSKLLLNEGISHHQDEQA